MNAEWENVDDAVLTRFDLVCAAMKKKLIKETGCAHKIIVLCAEDFAHRPFSGTL
jgi:hypothetical protein